MPIKYFIKSHKEIIAESSDPKQLLKQLKIIPLVKCMDCHHTTCGADREDELFSSGEGDFLILPMCVGFSDRTFQVYVNNDCLCFDTYQDAMKFAYSEQYTCDLSLEESLILQKHINYIEQEEGKLQGV